METRAGAVRRIRWYLYMGLAFLFWENAIGALLGIYHFELRRTLWGIAFYGALFLLFGGLTEIIDFFYRRFLRKFDWPGQKHVWILALLVFMLWGDFYRGLLIHALAIKPFAARYEVILTWLLLTFAAAVVINVVLAKRHHRLPFSSVQISALSFVAILYLILSTKITYFYSLQSRPLSAASVCFVIVNLGFAWIVTWILLRWNPKPRTFHRLLLLAPIVLTLLVVLASSQLPSMSSPFPRQARVSRSDKPNIIIMLFDALRDDQVGPRGSDRSLTPTIDQLASAGRRYPVCHSVTSWTLPSVGSLLTSQLPHKIGLMEEELRPLPVDIPTLPTVLHQHGYYTAGISANPLISDACGFSRLFQDLQYLWPRGSYQLFLPFHSFLLGAEHTGEWAYQFGFCSTDLAYAHWSQMSRRAVKLMEKHADEPFFFYLHYMEPHGPYLAKPFQKGLLNFKQISLAPYFINRQAAHSKEGRAFVQNNAAQLVATLLLRYQAGVEVADLAVKDMLQNLDRLGLADNTIIIVTADHGEEFMEHGHWDHRNSLYEETVRIPLIIYIPEALHRPLPQRSAGISEVDIAPTLLDLAGVNEEIPNSDGQSFLRMEPEEKRPVYLAFQMFRRFWQGVVVDSLKLVVIENQITGQCDTLFYDLAKDPLEKSNLYPCDSAIFDSLGALIRDEFRQPIPERSREPVRLTPDERERLRALGYIN